MHNYHDTYKILPSGGMSGGNRLSWHVLILPFVELPGLYDLVNFNNSSGNGYDLAAAGFVCPSDPNTRVNYTGRGANMGRGNYAAVGSDDLIVNNFWNTKWTNLSSTSRGTMGSGDAARLADIIDGTANVFAGLEVQAGTAANDPRGTWAYAPGVTVFGNNGVNSAIINVVPPADSFQDVVNTPLVRMACVNVNNNSSHGAKSYHPGGCLALLADASTRFVSDGVDQTLFRYLRAIADGNAVKAP